MSKGTDIFDLTGKVAIVTGATKGIGRAMVGGLAAAGASVVASSRQQDLCATVATEAAAAPGGLCGGAAGRGLGVPTGSASV